MGSLGGAWEGGFIWVKFNFSAEFNFTDARERRPTEEGFNWTDNLGLIELEEVSALGLANLSLACFAPAEDFTACGLALGAALVVERIILAGVEGTLDLNDVDL